MKDKEIEDLRSTGELKNITSPISSQAAVNADKPEMRRKVWYSRGHLPHFDKPGAVQSITFRLIDSVPQKMIERWKSEYKLEKRRGVDSQAIFKYRMKIESYMDSGTGSCVLKDSRISEIVQNTLLHFDGERYKLLVWCIMPNHVHVLIETVDKYPLSKVIGSWKNFSSHQANKILDRKGSLWMREHFDRFVRNEKHLMKVVEYIHYNPVKAGLVDKPENWKWSSASYYLEWDGKSIWNGKFQD